MSMRSIRSFNLAALAAVLALGLFSASSGIAADGHTTSKFDGVKANKGTAMHSRQGSSDMLTWSEDFKIPDTPAPHWQVVDTKGDVYLLNRLKIKGGVLSGEKENRTITLPPYVHDIAKIQIWCAWAEALLGEASFAAPIQTASGEAATMQAGMMKGGR